MGRLGVRFLPGDPGSRSRSSVCGIQSAHEKRLNRRYRAGVLTSASLLPSALRRIREPSRSCTSKSLANGHKNFGRRSREIARLESDAEETRTRLVAQIDRLERLRDRLRYTRAASEVEAFVKNARSYLDHVKAIADDAQHLASGLENFGKPPTTN
jgi:DNA repair exonuclease SbcCD ATPase subunit